MLVILLARWASSGTAVAAPRTATASPLKLAGREFKPHESVRRLVSGTRSSARRVHASCGGRFTVTFQGFALHPCGADLRATARGSRGSFAALRQVFAECPQPAMPH